MDLHKLWPTHCIIFWRFLSVRLICLGHTVTYWQYFRKILPHFQIDWPNPSHRLKDIYIVYETRYLTSLEKIDFPVTRDSEYETGNPALQMNSCHAPNRGMFSKATHPVFPLQSRSFSHENVCWNFSYCPITPLDHNAYFCMDWNQTSSFPSLTPIGRYQARSEFRISKSALRSTSWSSHISRSYWLIF
jgi:hypothetical protein